MKKLLAILLAMLMVLSLVACGAKEEAAAPEKEEAPAATEEKTEEKKEEAPAAEAEEVTLKMSIWLAGNEPMFEAIFEDFTAAYPNIKVEVEAIQATEYDTWLQTAVANGNVGDIVMMRPFTGGSNAFSSGKIVALTTENVPNLANFPETAIYTTSNADGECFAVPMGNTLEGVLYNKRIFEEVGVEVPTTFQELLDVCQKIKDAGYIPMASCTGEAWFVSEEMSSTMLMANISGDDWVRDLYAGEAAFTDDCYVAMLDQLKQLTQYYPDFNEGLGAQDCQSLFATEQAAMYMSGSYEISYLTSYNPDLQLGAFTYPSVDGNTVNMNSGCAFGIGAYSESEHLEEALTFLNWLASKEGGESFCTNLTGFICPNPVIADIEDPLVQEWQALTNGKTLVHMLGYETMNEQAPDYSTAIGETVYNMYVNDWTPEEAAAYMQDMMSWYWE